METRSSHPSSRRSDDLFQEPVRFDPCILHRRGSDDLGGIAAVRDHHQRRPAHLAAGSEEEEVVPIELVFTVLGASAVVVFCTLAAARLLNW